MAGGGTKIGDDIGDNTMTKRILLTVALLTFAPLLCWGAVAIELSDIGVAGKDDEIVLGEWHGGFDACLAKADAEHIPMLAMWSNSGCGHCENVYTAIITDQFIQWRRGGGNIGKIILLMMKGGYSGNGYEKNCPAYMWTWGPDKKLNLFPFVALYWNKPDGTVIREHHVGEDLTLRRFEEGTTNLIAKLEKTFAGWQGVDSVSGGATTFVCGTNAAHRLEAEIGVTTYVDVPLVRTNAVASVATNYLYVAQSDGVATNEVVWTANEASRAVRVALPAEPPAKAGDMLALQLADATQTNILETSGITFVEPVPSASDNPLWIGERGAKAEGDVKQLAFGEWTMDLDVATNRAAQAEGTAWTLAVADGSLWCPDCKRFATNLAESVAFKNWATSNQVALVELDVDRGALPTLLSSELRFGTSGAAYLSRKMADREKAEEILARNSDLVTNLWNDVALPAVTRLSVPTLILLDKGGRRVARLANDRLSFSPDYMIHRLDEMMAAASDDGEELNARPDRTPLMVACPSTTNGWLSAVDTRDCLRIAPTGEAGRVYVRLDVLDAEKAPGWGTLRLVNGSGNLLDAGADTNYNAAATSVAVATDLAVGQTAYVQVSSDTTSTNSPQYAERAADTRFRYRLSVRDVLVLGTTEATVPIDDVRRDEGVLVHIRAGEAYRFEGLDELGDALSAYLKKSNETGPNGETLYQGLADGDVFLPVAAGAETIVAAVWQSGTVGFVQTALSVNEADGKGDRQTVALKVARANGASGGATVRVTLDAARSTCLEDRYLFAEQQTLSWANGESGVKEATLVVIDDTIHDGDETLVFTLVPEGGGVVTIPEEGKTLTLTIREDDEATPGLLSIASTTPAMSGVAKAAATEQASFQVFVSRNGGATGDVTGYVRMLAEDGTELDRSKEPLAWPHRTAAADRVRVADFVLPARAEHAKVVFEVVGGNGIEADVSNCRVSVELLDATVPRFEHDAIDLTVYRSVRFDKAVKVIGLPESAADVRVSRTAGALPPGVVAELVEPGCSPDWHMSLSGTPTKTGTYTASFRVSCVTTDGRLVRGGTIAVRIVVEAVPGEDVKDADGNVTATGNPAAVRSVTYRDMPLAFALPGDPTEGAKGRLVGLLTLTLSPRGRLSAKVRPADGATASQRGASYRSSSWASYDPQKGELRASLLGDADSFSVHVDADGTVRADFAEGFLDVLGEQSPETTVTLKDPAWTATDSAARWQGRYTVQLPQGERISSETLKTAAGMGGLALRMTADAATRGRMTFAGFLPDGRTVSGSAVLGRPDSEDEEAKVRLPLLCAAAYRHNGFAGILTIKPDARKTHADTVRSNWFVDPDPAAWPYWLADEGFFDGARGGVATSLNVYGAYYDAEIIQLNRMCEQTYGCTNLVFYVEAPAERMEETTADVLVGEKTIFLSPDSEAAGKIRLAFNAATGIFSGAFKATVDGIKRTATYRGVVLPGWGGCEACGIPLPGPFGGGACWFRDTDGLCGKDGFEIRIDLDDASEF